MDWDLERTHDARRDAVWKPVVQSAFVAYERATALTARIGQRLSWLPHSEEVVGQGTALGLQWLGVVISALTRAV